VFRNGQEEPLSLHILLDRPAAPRRGADVRPWPAWVRVAVIGGLSAGLWWAILAFAAWALARL
jgi:hypothetical protein